MIFKNRGGEKIEASKLKLETTIEMKLDGIKSDRIKNIDSLDMKIPSIVTNKPSLYSEKLTSDIMKWPLLNIRKNIHMHQNSPKIFPPRTFKETLYFKLNFFCDSIRSTFF